jgi:hypothetical protein
MPADGHGAEPSAAPSDVKRVAARPSGQSESAVAVTGVAGCLSASVAASCCSAGDAHTLLEVEAKCRRAVIGELYRAALEAGVKHRAIHVRPDEVCRAPAAVAVDRVRVVHMQNHKPSSRAPSL